MSTSRKSQLLLALGGVAIVLLLAAVFTLGSLKLPFEIHDWDQVVVLYALSTFIVAALLVFTLILTRSLLRLWAERRAHQPGSRFKTKMVLGAIAVSFLPVIFLFFVSYALLNRTLVLWFPRPLEVATQSSRDLLDEIGLADSGRMTEIAKDVAANSAQDTAQQMIHSFDESFERGADIAWELSESGQPVAVGVNSNFKLNLKSAACGRRSSSAAVSASAVPATNVHRFCRRWFAACLLARNCGNTEESTFLRGARKWVAIFCWPDETFQTIFRIASGKSRHRRRPTVCSANNCELTKHSYC